MTEHNINPVFLSTSTAREIYDLGDVEREINHLLQLASSCIALLTIPELDPPEEGTDKKRGETPSSEASTPREPPPASTAARQRLPIGEERAEQFVLEATQYYETLDRIHLSLRTAMAYLRRARIAPATITAPPPNFVPPSFGVGPDAGLNARGLQETRLERDAWRGVVNALERLKQARLQSAPEQQPPT